MNTVSSLFSSRPAIDRLRGNGYGDADFQVTATPVLYKASGTDKFGGILKLEDKKVYYREDTGDALAIHGDRYEPVSHTMMIDTARNVLERSKLNLADIKETIQVGDNGGVCFIRHQLPNHEIRTPDGDTAILEMLHINSFNSAWPYQATVGALQNACTNHQVFLGSTAGIYKARHTQKLSVDQGAHQMNRIINILDTQNEIWARWYNSPVTTASAFRYIADATGSKFALGKLKEGEVPSSIMTMPTAYNNSSLMYAWTQYREQYAPKMGANLWSVYNALTDWSSHHVGTRKNTVDIPVAQVKKSEKVQQVIADFQLAA
tara:strand:+ start:68 stop:1024 length:957 start_codon:yes stop_codon:yes gene_type:complete